MKKQIKPIVAVTLCMSLVTNSLISSNKSDVGSYAEKSAATVAETKYNVGIQKNTAIPTIAVAVMETVGAVYAFGYIVGRASYLAFGKESIVAETVKPADYNEMNFNQYDI